jgi:phosphate/sulfate permease
MRTFRFAIGGLVLGAGLALLMTLPQSDMSRAVDAQGLHLIGVFFIIMPVAGVVGLILGLLTAYLTRR